MKKKIVIIGPAYPYRGGQALVEAHLFSTLTKLGYDCHTISFSLLYPKIFFPGKTQFDQSKNVFFSHQDRIHRIINSINPLSWYRAIQKIKALAPDNVIFIWWMPFFGPAYGTIAHFVKKLTGAKITFLVENYISHEDRWFDRFFSKITLDIADYFVCQSEFVKKQIAAVHQKPIFKTTLSVYDCYNFGTYDKASARRFLNIPEGDRVILFFGLIRRYKGLDKLIRAFPMIKNGDDNYSLLIVGECYEKISYYEDIIREEGIEDKTTLINQFIDNEKIEPYFKAADMVCLPYNSASQSGILMIAYGFNIPVVVNDVGGLSELVVEGKTGTVIPNNSPAAIAKGVAKVYEYGETENFEENIGNLNQHLGYSNVEEMMGKMLETEDVTQMNNKR